MKSKLAIASFILGLVSFVQLFGLEKAVLAVIFGAFAIKEISNSPELNGKNYAFIGVILGTLYILVLFILMIMKGPEILRLISKII